MGDIKARNTAFSKLERLEAKVNGIDPDTITEGKIKIYIKSAEDFMRRIDDAHLKIVNLLTDPGAVADQENILEPMEAKYQEMMAKLYNFQVTSGASTRQTQQLRLPDIQLPVFDGKYEDWPSFSDLFKATIEKNSALSPSQKLQYLKSCTRGEAHTLIKSFTVTDSNYKEAWKLMISRYSNQREIVNSLLRKLVHQPTIKSDSASSIQALLNTTLESIRSLKVMGRPTDHWDDLITFIIIEKLDAETRAEWARTLKGSDPSKFQELQEFLEQYIRTIHARGSIKQQPGSRSNGSGQGRQVHHITQQVSSSCPACKEAHPLYRCPKLTAMDPEKRLEAAKASKVCLNCLREGHMSKECSSPSRCRKCGKKHNTFLHIDYQSNKPNGNSKQGNPAGSSHDNQQGMQIRHTVSSSSTLFKTALVDIMDCTSKKCQVRVFIDDGADGGLIKDSTMIRLGLPRTRADITIFGVGGNEVIKSKWKTHVRLFSQVTNSFIDVDLYSVPKVTCSLNSIPVSTLKSWSHISGLQLADPFFHEGGEIDILIGSDIAPYILKDGLKQADRSSPVAQNTIFGWVLFGNVSSSPSSQSIQINTCKCEVNDILRKFWEVEEVQSEHELTREEKACEEHFLATHSRTNQGRYVLRLPFNETKSQLGSTKETAYHRFLALERRFIRQPQHRQAYIQFMKEYEELGHMEKVPTDKKSSQTAYLPHHFVLKEESTTTKQRTVFDGSAASSTGISLNDTLMVGATVQPDLFTLIIRFRLKKVALKADIAKMYRQFAIAEEDRDFQRILWREDSSLPIQEFRLTTVTYGTACAPFLATRCLNRLAEEEGRMYPEAADALLNNTYVDDFLGCSDTTESANQLVQQLINITAAAGMEIRKWCSNDPDVLASLPSHLKDECSSMEFKESSNDSVKALGIKWQPSSDHFMFNVNINQTAVVTKRHLLSEIAKTFDPLGWLAPLTIKAKILLQKVWLESSDWDKQLSPQLQDEWSNYLQDLKDVETIRIPRCVVASPPTRYELHGFSDSSELAMASSVFLKSVYGNGTCSVNLITSKTKVAPLKAISLPKLELTAAKLLAETVKAVQSALKLDLSIYCWTDSTITLRWISSHSRRWKTFVSNRVSSIQSHVPPENWHHVKSEENPADLPSRGVTTAKLKSSQLWWHGPSWLQLETYPVYPQQYNENELKKEERSKQLAVFHMSKNSTHMTLFKSFSSFSKTCRICAYLIRFVNFLKSKRKIINKQPLSTSEVNSSKLSIIRWMQHVSFPEEIQRLQKFKSVALSSKLVQLNPFLDKDEILRVGGRIQQADLPLSTRHPIIMPHDHPCTTLIINDTHLSNLHGGFTLTLATIRREYWILRSRDIIRNILRKCVICRRHRARTTQQLMGNLPTGRVNATKAFLHTGVDFAGPFNVKAKKGRRHPVEKTYFAIFVCLATKAVHLESVDTLSSEGFIACFERFISRRGSCAHMYSDNGTNFVGADRILKQFLEEQTSQIQQQFCNHGTQWHFNPPSSPHQGGLWEAGVKSVKYHLYRVVGTTVLILDQFQTFLCRIEACLNSRPLCALSSDPVDLDALTPGHFLVGGPLTAVPEPDVTLIKQNRLSYWETIRQLSQSFWKRWSSEYVTSLQQRFKWTQKKENLQVGDLVVIMDDNLPMTKWKLGRIITTHPGADTLVRKVTLRTAAGELIRPVQKLSPLILQDEN